MGISLWESNRPTVALVRSTKNILFDQNCFSNITEPGFLRWWHGVLDGGPYYNVLLRFSIWWSGSLGGDLDSYAMARILKWILQFFYINRSSCIITTCGIHSILHKRSDIKVEFVNILSSFHSVWLTTKITRELHLCNVDCERRE